MPRPADPLSHVISFRVTAGEGRKLQRLRATFPDQEWGEVMRWVFGHPQVRAVIDERLTEDQPSAQSWGLDASLPTGDRT